MKVYKILNAISVAAYLVYAITYMYIVIYQPSQSGNILTASEVQFLKIRGSLVEGTELLIYVLHIGKSLMWCNSQKKMKVSNYLKMCIKDNVIILGMAGVFCTVAFAVTNSITFNWLEPIYGMVIISILFSGYILAKRWRMHTLSGME